MATKPKTGIYIGIIIVIIILAIIIGVVVVNNNKGGDNGSANSNSNSGNTTQDVSTLTENELINADDVVIVDYGEYDEMQKISKAIQNGEMTGKVVQIDGDISHPGTKYSIVQTSENGSQKIGTEFIIVDGDESDYPVDGSKAFIVGKVAEKEPLYFVIETLKAYVKKM